MTVESELPSQAVTVFARSSKKRAVLCCPVGRLCVSCWLILDTFRQVVLSVGLKGFQKGAHSEDSLPIPPYIQHHLLWMKTGLWCGWWRYVSLAPPSLPFHVVKYPLFIPVTICFKNGTFWLHLSRELHVEILSRRVFLLMWNPNIKAINITKLVQMIFNIWFGNFEYVGCLSCSRTLIVLNQCPNLISVNFHCPERNL